MNFRTTVVLLVVLALFAGAYAYVTKHYPTEAEGKSPSLLGAFEQTRVEKVRVDNQAAGYRVELVRLGPDAWKMTYPLEDAPADEALVSQILSAVAYNTRKPVTDLPPGGGTNLEGFGLGKPRAVLDFELKGAEGKPGSRLRLLVGGEDLRKDDIFCGVGPPVLPGKESDWKPTGVVRTPSNVWNSVNKTVDQYRDPRVFSIRPSDAEGLDVVRDGALVLSLAKEEGNWQERLPRRERADRFAADGFVGQVLGWRIARFHENAPGPDANYGLDPARIEVVARAGSRTERLRIGKEHADGLLARRADSKFVWALKPEDVKGLEKNPEDLLDRKLFRTFSDEVTEVRIGRPEGEIVLSREGGSRVFRLKQPKDLATSADRTDALLADLEKLEMTGFEPPVAPAEESRPASGPVLDAALKRYGLDAAPRWLQVAAKGKPTKVFLGKREGDVSFVRREGCRPLPDFAAHHGARQLQRLKGDARPQEDLVRTVALLGADRSAQLVRCGGAPDLVEGSLPEVAQRGVCLADAHVAVGVDDGAQHPRPAGDDLPLLARGLHLCPLQHGLDDRSVSPLLAWQP